MSTSRRIWYTSITKGKDKDKTKTKTNTETKERKRLNKNKDHKQVGQSMPDSRKKVSKWFPVFWLLNPSCIGGENATTSI